MNSAVFSAAFHENVDRLTILLSHEILLPAGHNSMWCVGGAPPGAEAKGRVFVLPFSGRRKGLLRSW